MHASNAVLFIVQNGKTVHLLQKNLLCTLVGCGDSEGEIIFGSLRVATASIPETLQKTGHFSKKQANDCNCW